MGQVMHKLKPGEKKEPTQDLALAPEIERIIKETFETDVVGTEGAKIDDLYRYIFTIIEKLRATQGMQYNLPSKEALQKAYKRYQNLDRPLTEGQCKEIIKELFTLQSFSLGQGTIDVLIYLFGFPIGALMLKKVIPGLRSMSDDVVIPVATSASVVFLAKTHRL